MPFGSSLQKLSLLGHCGRLGLSARTHGFPARVDYFRLGRNSKNEVLPTTKWTNKKSWFDKLPSFEHSSNLRLCLTCRTYRLNVAFWIMRLFAYALPLVVCENPSLFFYTHLMRIDNLFLCMQTTDLSGCINWHVGGKLFTWSRVVRLGCNRGVST